MIVGFGFTADFAQLEKSLPNLSFWKNITKFLDLQDYYKSVMTQQNWTGAGLKNVCEHLLGKKICKVEQMSNWENRPLRHSQEHYAALDAWILTVLIEEMEKIAKKGKFIKTIGKPDSKNVKEKKVNNKSAP